MTTVLCRDRSRQATRYADRPIPWAAVRASVRNARPGSQLRQFDHGWTPPSCLAILRALQWSVDYAELSTVCWADKKAPDEIEAVTRIVMTARELRTPRLLLRRWVAADREAFASLNADPRVMEHLPGMLDRTESDALVDRIEQHFEDHGFGLWAVEIPGTVPFAGFVGLSIPTFQAHFTPCVEVGWRLAVEHWGRGYATEASRAAVIFSFERLNLAEVVSFTVPENYRSRRVMERIGMVYRPADDFDHPNASEPRRQHVLYRIKSKRAAQHPNGADAPIAL